MDVLDGEDAPTEQRLDVVWDVRDGERRVGGLADPLRRPPKLHEHESRAQRVEEPDAHALDLQLLGGDLGGPLEDALEAVLVRHLEPRKLEAHVEER
jgi:hypothetical protein